MRILNMRQLVSAHIRQCFDLEEALFGHRIVQLRAGHGMRDGNLNSFGIEFLGEIDGFLNGLASFAGQPDDEIAVNADTDLAAILHEGAGHFYGRALFDVFQNLRIAGFESDDEQSRASIRHGFQGVVITVHPGGGGPLKFQGLELGAKIEDAVLADVESVVIEENFFHLREIFDGLFYFTGHVFRGTGALRMAGNRLGPHAESAQRRTAAGSIKGHVRIQEERYVVALNLQVALVNICGEGQRVEFRGVQLLARRSVDDLAVFAIADAHDFAERFAMRVFDNGMVEFTAGDKIDIFAGRQCFIGLDVAMRPNEGNLHTGIGFFNLANELDVALESHGGGKQNEEFVVFANLHGLLPVDLVRRGVEQTTSRNHSSWIGEPNGIPIRFDLAGCGPTRTCAAVEILKTRRV